MSENTREYSDGERAAGGAVGAATTGTSVAISAITAAAVCPPLAPLIAPVTAVAIVYGYGKGADDPGSTPVSILNTVRKVLGFGRHNGN